MINKFNFKSWIILSESKGIRLTDEIKSQIFQNLDHIVKTAIEVKKDPSKETIDPTAEIVFKDPYKNTNRQVSIYVVNDPENNDVGSFSMWHGININVANIEEKKLNNNEIETILFHEFVHALAPAQTTFKLYDKQPAYIKASDNYTKYMLHPWEFEAYTGQMINKILNSPNKFKGTPKEATCKQNLYDALSFLRNPKKSDEEKIYGFMANPEYWKLFHIYTQLGTPKQKRKLNERLSNAIMKALDELKS